MGASHVGPGGCTKDPSRLSIGSEGNWTFSAECAIACIDIERECCTPETYLMLLTNVNLDKQKRPKIKNE